MNITAISQCEFSQFTTLASVGVCRCCNCSIPEAIRAKCLFLLAWIEFVSRRIFTIRTSLLLPVCDCAPYDDDANIREDATTVTSKTTCRFIQHCTTTTTRLHKIWVLELNVECGFVPAENHGVPGVVSWWHFQSAINIHPHTLVAFAFAFVHLHYGIWWMCDVCIFTLFCCSLFIICNLLCFYFPFSGLLFSFCLFLSFSRHFSRNSFELLSLLLLPLRSGVLTRVASLSSPLRVRGRCSIWRERKRSEQNGNTKKNANVVRRPFRDQSISTYDYFCLICSYKTEIAERIERIIKIQSVWFASFPLSWRKY